ncbi:DUF551 domain-containing protein [Pontibacter pamirensis]|uniref:DUF551 domain-containing protein n=1 Tax=Pontibacter pamirensis TaxID=2562824 RepID=UPI0013896590
MSIEERLPEQGKPIILTLTDDKGARTVELGYVDAAKAIHTLIPTEATFSVVAWMPLPDPYMG